MILKFNTFKNYFTGTKVLKSLDLNYIVKVHV